MRAPTLLLLALFSLPLHADDRAQLRDLRRDAASAYRALDWPRFLALCRQAAALAPGHPAVLHNLACAEAKSGHAADAAAAALRVVSMGVDTGLLEDEDLASVRDDPAFAPVRTKLIALAKPVGKAQEAFRLKERTLLTEGIAFDPATKRFFLSSVHERKVVVFDAAGKESDLVPPGRDGVFGILALRADPARRVLWATSAAVPEMQGFSAELEGRSELLRFDLDSGKLVARHALAEPGRHVLNDLELGADGTVFASDSSAGGIWLLSPGGKSLEPLLPSGALGSPQGMVLSPDGKTLIAADYGDGLFAIDLGTRKLARVEAPADVCLGGIDGLVAAGRDLLAVQNGVKPHRVLRIALDASRTRVKKAEVLLANDPRFDEPTLAVVVGGCLYVVAASQWPAFDPKVFDPAKLKEPVVLRIALR